MTASARRWTAESLTCSTPRSPCTPPQAGRRPRVRTRKAPGSPVSKQRMCASTKSAQPPPRRWRGGLEFGGQLAGSHGHTCSRQRQAARRQALEPSDWRSLRFVSSGLTISCRRAAQTVSPYTSPAAGVVAAARARVARARALHHAAALAGMPVRGPGRACGPGRRAGSRSWGLRGPRVSWRAGYRRASSPGRGPSGPCPATPPGVTVGRARAAAVGAVAGSSAVFCARTAGVRMPAPPACPCPGSATRASA